MIALRADRHTGAPALEFWFEFASPYSYLSAMHISEIAGTAGLSVLWRPFLLGPIFAAQGWQTSPFSIYPAKGRYMWRDLQRLCAVRGLPFVQPDIFPQNGLNAARCALVALRHDAARGQAFCQNVFHAQFGLGSDISQPEILARAWTAAGLPDLARDTAQDPDIKTLLRDQTTRAQQMGIFGAPFFTHEEELFWGDDRLEQAITWARNSQIQRPANTVPEGAETPS